MNGAKVLRGMAWDHPRAVDPLRTISAQWSRDRDIEVIWEARPLKDFEDQPLEQLASAYDLVLMDYPFVGTAATSGLIVPVDDWVDQSYLADQQANTVGPSYASYTWDNKQWALAIDAACQVSALREDLWQQLNIGAFPDTWDDVASLAKELCHSSCKVAIPLNPNHAYCAFISIGIGNAGKQFWPRGGSVNKHAALDALHFLRELAPYLHAKSRRCDPIGISDHMCNTEEIIYVPLMFGYSSYARTGFRKHRLRFGNAPRGDSGEIGSVLGGVGIALSSRSTNPQLAAELARLLVSAETQAGIYVKSGGQPGHAAAWNSTPANGLVNDFFKNTRLTIDNAFLRPRVSGHRRFQELAGELIHNFIWQTDSSAADCLSAFNRLVAQWIPNWEKQNEDLVSEL